MEGVGRMKEWHGVSLRLLFGAIILSFLASCTQLLGGISADGFEGKWETGIFEGYSAIEFSKGTFSNYTEPSQYVSIDTSEPGLTINIFHNNPTPLQGISGTYLVQGSSVTLTYAGGTTLILSFSQSGNALTLVNADPQKGSLKYDRVATFGTSDIPARRSGGNNSTNIISAVFEMKGLGYNDYVDGGHCGYGYDFTNKTIRTISSVRTKTYTINKYPSFGNMDYTFTSFQAINPLKTERNFWIYLGDTNTFYSSHTVNEVLITFSDGKEHLWTKN